MKNVYIVLTKACNMKCIYCLAGDKSNDNMTEDVAEKVVEFINWYTAGEPLVINFIGGEPLLRFDLIVKMVNLIDKKLWPRSHYLYNVTTNGLLLNEQTIMFFLVNKFNITFSIDGYGVGNDVNRKLMNGKGSFSVLENRIKLLASIYSLGAVSIRMTVTPESTIYLYDSILIFTDLGFKRFGLQINSSALWTIDMFEKLEDQLFKLSSLYIEKYFTKKKLSIKCFDHKINLQKKIAIKHICCAGKDNLAILPDGKIIPCYEMLSTGNKYVIGSVQEKNIADNRDIFCKYTNNLTKMKQACLNCKVEKLCEAFCTAISCRDKDSGESSFYARCEFQKKIIKLATLIGNKIYLKDELISF